MGKDNMPQACMAVQTSVSVKWGQNNSFYFGD